MEIRELRKLYKSIRQDSVHEQESYDIVLNSFREMFPSKTKLNYNFYLSLRPVAVSLLAFVFVFIAGFGTITVAKNTVPGDLLYPVKRVVEKSRMVLVVNQSKKAVLRAEILTNRLSEVSVLTEKAKKGDKKYELELNVLAQNFTNDLKVLTKQIGNQIQDSELAELSDGELAEPPFPDDELLYIDEEMTSQGSLPIEDNRQVYTVMPSEELEKLLAETKELLAENNLALAFVKLQEAEKLVEEKEQPKIEEDVSQESEQPQDETYIIDEEPKQILPEEPIVPELEQEPQPEAGPSPAETSIINDNFSSSIGQLQKLKDPKIGGMTREK